MTTANRDDELWQRFIAFAVHVNTELSHIEAGLKRVEQRLNQVQQRRADHVERQR